MTFYSELDIKKYVEYLKNDEIISVPTDTVYGLCANVYSEKALKKIFEIKKRPLTQNLAILVKDKNEIYKYAKNICQKAKMIIDKFLPGPLTIILESNGIINSSFIVKNNTIAFRVIENKFLYHILAQIDFPLALTSANIHGSENCFTAEQVKKQLSENVKCIIAGGKTKYCQESTIIHFKNNEIVIDREGVILRNNFIY